eukprot:scaffold212203_cov33-Tisochrysis_lutea.AAC.3
MTNGLRCAGFSSALSAAPASSRTSSPPATLAAAAAGFFTIETCTPLVPTLFGTAAASAGSSRLAPRDGEGCSGSSASWP